MTKLNYISIFIIFFLISCLGKKSITKFEIPTDNLEDIILNKSVKDKDTIYFYFDYSENLKKSRIQIDPKENDTLVHYEYYESRNNIYGTKREIVFYKGKYISSTRGKKIADIKVISKRFLRKNKDIIIFPKDLEGNNMYKYVAKEFLSNKVYYIIDTAERKGNKFIARQVRYSFGGFIEI